MQRRGSTTKNVNAKSNIRCLAVESLRAILEYCTSLRIQKLRTDIAQYGICLGSPILLLLTIARGLVWKIYNLKLQIRL